MSNVRWCYMDHWREPSARGPVTPYASVRHADRFIKQLVALGFEGLDTFYFSLPAQRALFGSLKGFEAFLRERGMQKVVSVFFAKPTGSPGWFFHRRQDHHNIVGFCARLMDQCAELALENFIVMPTNTHWQMEPITDESLQVLAELWNRVGEVTRRYGVRTSIHHEFWGGIRTWDQIEKFYAWTDPQLVWFFCDTAQHVIAGVDPVMLYEHLHQRCSGFHFKDTHDVDTREDYRRPPDAELLAPTIRRWFWEMGTPGGLVDFPALMHALRRHDYSGWLSMEHDKADIGGGSYAESTAVAKWYADNVLAPIYR